MHNINSYYIKIHKVSIPDLNEPDFTNNWDWYSSIQQMFIDSLVRTRHWALTLTVRCWISSHSSNYQSTVEIRHTTVTVTIREHMKLRDNHDLVKRIGDCSKPLHSCPLAPWAIIFLSFCSTKVRHITSL